MSPFAKFKRITPQKIKQKLAERVYGIKYGEKSPARKILFDHIPKCGGSSLTQLFRVIYGAHRVAPTYMGEQASIAKQSFRDFDVVIGHLGGKIFDNWPENFFCCTLIRDPIDRALSTYYYFKKLPNSGIPQVESVRDLSLEEFVYSTDRQFVNEILNNPLTVHFAAAHGYDGDYKDAEVVWQAAVDGFNQYDVIGICEDHERSSRAIFNALGIKMPEIDYNEFELNKNTKRKKINEIPPALLAKLKERNQYDIALYKAAVERLHNRPYKHLLDFPCPPHPPSVFTCNVTEVEIRGELSGTSTIKSGESISIKIRFSLSKSTQAFIYNFRIINDAHDVLFGISSNNTTENQLLEPGDHELNLSFINPLKDGKYHISFGLIDAASLDSPLPFGDVPNSVIASFNVSGNVGLPFHGRHKIPLTHVSIE